MKICFIVNIFALLGCASGFKTPLASVSPSRSILSSSPHLHPHIDPRKVGLRMSSGSEDDATTKKSVSPEKIIGRKKRVTMGYKISSFGFAAFTAFILAVTRKPFFAAGPLLASGNSYILLGAAQNDRLKSDTYKRLNLAQITYSGMGFVAGVLMNLNITWKITCLVTFINSIKGYGYGLKGWELGSACAKEDITKGIQSTVKCLTNVNLKSVGYLAATVLLGALNVSKLSEAANIFVSGGANYMLGTRLFRASKIMLLAVTTLTLKDAADRDRLEGTTFIELNFLSSLVFASWLFDYAMKGPLPPLGIAMAVFSAYSAFNGLSSVMKKKGKK